MSIGARVAAAVLLGLAVLSVSAQAQEIVLSGTLVDATDAVLPGVTVTALHVDTGNPFVAVSEADGQYRIGALRPGLYTVTAVLSGFTTVTHERLELLIGQRATLNFKMTVSALQESLTVTGQAPLVDTTQSKMGGNIDSRQMQALPVFGRNWVQLTMLAPGSRANAVDDAPLGNLAGAFQLNMDGQQITATQTFSSVLGQPKFSRDAIGEFELVSSRFDATQGRSLGVQVNAVTKSGTNQYAGSVASYFRHDSLNAKDFIVNRVLPYSNQQFVTTFGGPIKKDKMHFFVHYEGEREPQSITFNSPYPRFNIPDLRATKTQHLGGSRVDALLWTNMRLLVRGSGWVSREPIENSRLNSGINHPSTLNRKHQLSGTFFASLLQTRGKTVNDIKFGWSRFHLDQLPRVVSPTIQLRGYTIGQPSHVPLNEHQDTLSIRDDLTMVRGNHEMKVGGEFLLPANLLFWSQFSKGVLVADLGAPPANLEDLFPVWDDPSTWNLAPLSSITRQYRKSIGSYNVHCFDAPSNCRRTKPIYGAWAQDNWRATSYLTLNLGLRWDYTVDGLGNDIEFLPFRNRQPAQYLDFGPRVGFAASLPGGRTVIRGGWGLYFAGLNDNNTHSLINEVAVTPEIRNDGRPNFASDPYNIGGGGRVPTLEEAKLMRREFTGNVINNNAGTPYSYQTSIGLQRQIGESSSFQADYVWLAGRRDQYDSANINLSYDPVTGVNYRFSDINRRPYPQFGTIAMKFMDGTSNYHALETGFTKRFSQRWQASATYTLSGYWNDYPTSPVGGAFPVAIDLGGEYGLGGVGSFGAPDQRNRAVLSGIWDLPYRLQISGMYFYGSGQRYATTYGGDLRDTGGYSSRLRPDGTIVPRNNFIGPAIHRVDMKLQHQLRLGNRVQVSLIGELFNVFNHQNFGLFTANEASANYGRPSQNLNVAYQPRMAQLGFRVMY